MLECYVTYDLISQKVPWEESVRLTAWFGSLPELNKYVFERRKDPNWRVVEVGVPTELSASHNQPYQRFNNVPGYHLMVKGWCVKCQIYGDATSHSSTCSNSII